MGDSVIEQLSYRDSSELSEKLLDWQAESWDHGLLSASIDSLALSDSLSTAQVYLGQKYSWGELMLEENIGILQNRREFGFRSRPGKTPFNRASFSLYRDRVLSKLEDNGFPFASAKYTDLIFRGDTLFAKLKIDKGPLVVIDSLILQSKTKINPVFLENYLEIKEGMPYSESLIRRIPKRIDEIPYLNVQKPTEVLFAREKANVYLYLKEQKASFANGVIGLQPDGQSGEIVITGQLELKLLNALKRGELMHIKWRKMQNETQDIQLSANYPYIFKTTLGLGGDLKIYRRDSTFSSVQSRFELNYLLKGGNIVGVFVSGEQSNRLANFSSPLGTLGNTRTSNYGVQLDYRQLDYRFNPIKGYVIELMATVGSKRITDTLQIIRENNVPQRSIQYEAELRLEKYFALGSRMTILSSVYGALKENPAILENEMYRIGGIARLRGFDEESILANRFFIGTLEWRYILGKNSRYFVFVDQAWYQQKGLNTEQEDSPLGFGTGISFETQAGIFSLSYALGQAFNNPILIRSAKIHFGFTSLF